MITDRYHALGFPKGCVTLAVLKPGNNLQRPFQFLAVRIGPPGGQLPADGDGSLDRGQRLLPPPLVAQPDRQLVQRHGEAAGGVRFSAAGVRSILGDSLAGKRGGELHAVLGHLGGQAGLGCQLQRAVEQVREPACWVVDGGGKQVGKVVIQRPVQSASRSGRSGATPDGALPR